MWIEFVGVVVGFVVLLLLVLSLTRKPTSARWSDLEVPARVPRGEPSLLTIAVDVNGPSTWVNAVGNRRQRVQPIVEWPIDTSQRGRYLVGPSRLEFADMFGMRVKTLATRELSEVIIVPRIVPVDALIDMTPLGDGLLDERLGHEHFHSIREYVSGDPMRMIHWRSSARAGKLMVRRLVDTTLPTLLVVLDLDQRSYNKTASEFTSFDADGFEAAVDLAASCVLTHCNPAQRVLLTTTRAGDAVTEISPRERNAALDWLALVQPVEEALPGRIDEIAKSRGFGHIALVTGRTSVLNGQVRLWSHIAKVTTLSA